LKLARITEGFKPEIGETKNENKRENSFERVLFISS
jgi:hypothetical protein